MLDATSAALRGNMPQRNDEEGGKQPLTVDVCFTTNQGARATAAPIRNIRVADVRNIRVADVRNIRNIRVADVDRFAGSKCW
jgi:hypothetical protein